MPNNSWMCGSIDTDQVQYVASDLDLHCLPRCVCSNTLSYYGIVITKAEAFAMSTHKVDFVAKLKVKFNVCNIYPGCLVSATHFLSLFPHCELSHFSPSIYRQWVL